MLVESPWVGHFQEKFEADQFQPPLACADPVDHYLQVREAFAVYKKMLKAPIGRKFPPTAALRALVEKTPVPLLTEWPSGVSPTLAFQCQLALLLAIAGDEKAAEKLAAQLAPAVLGKFWALWTLEKEYDEKETRISCALFLRAIGQAEEADKLYSADLPKSLFFSFLFQQNAEIHCPLASSEQIAWTLSGSRGGVGAIRVGDVHIPSFGPHAAPLSNPKLFGIEPGEKNWFCSSALKEVWFQIETQGSNSFSLQSFGVSAENPMAFVFYVTAADCRIGDRHFKPKSLHRFLGEGDEVHFGRVTLTVERPLKIELIPLSGDKSYWGASFLLAYWLPPVSNKLFFQVK